MYGYLLQYKQSDSLLVRVQQQIKFFKENIYAVNSKATY